MFLVEVRGTKRCHAQEIFMAVLPFIALQIIGLALVVAFPQIALWLPETIGH